MLNENDIEQLTLQRLQSLGWEYRYGKDLPVHEGEFARGELVKVFNTEGKPLALGLVRYGDEALRRIKGQKSAGIEHLLGYEFGTVAIHSDEMVVY